MSHIFLADLARRVSLHPSCRAELRHHWPAPHYHKTPQDVAAEAEETRRRHAARAASTADGGNVSSSGGDAAAREPFNPFDHFRVRKRSLRRRRRRRRQRPDSSQPPVIDTETAKKDATTAITSVDAAPRSSSSSNGGGVGVIARTTSAGESKPARATAPTAARRASLMFPAKRNPQVSRSSGRDGKSGTATREATSAPTQTSSSTSPGTTTAASPASQQPARRSGAMPSKKGSVRSHSESQTDLKAAAAAAVVRNSGSSRSSSCSSASRSASTDTRRDSDLDSDELEPCHDPLHIRLPRTPAHPTTGGVSRPVRVTVRWSGAAQRRRRHVRQLQKRIRSEADFAPRREITMTPSGFEMANSETSPFPSDPHLHQQQQQQQQGRAYRVPATSALHAAQMTAAAADEEDDDHESHILRSCSSDMKGHGEDTSPTRPPAVSVMVGGGGVSASASVATSHSLRPPSTVDEVCLVGCDTSVEVRAAQQQQQQQQQHASAGSASAVGSSAHTRSSGRSQGPQPHPSAATAAATEEVEGRYHRQPARKSTTIFSQSTATAPRTSLLGVTSSELPTPASSAAEPYAVPSPHSYLRRPNSLLIVRSPPQDSCVDDVLTASSGVYYYSCPGAFSRGGLTTAPAGPHGLQGGNQLRVTYVTNNANRGGTTGNGSSTLNSNDVSFTAEGGAGAAAATASASRTARSRGLAHVPRPYALTLSGQGYPDALGGCANNGSSTFSHVRSHSGSPTTVVVPSSSGGHTNAATGANVSSHITPPSSLPSTPLVTTAAATAAAAGQQSPPPQVLSMKAVLGQRRRSSLLRQQQAQQQAQQHQRHQSPFRSFFPSPEAVAANLLYQKRATRTAPPKLQRVESAASSTADTVAFTPLNVMVGTKTNSPAHSPLVLHGPSAVDGEEHSPLPTATMTRLDASASPFDTAQSAKQTLSSSSVNLHDDPQLLSDHPGYAFTPLHPQRDHSGLSTIGGGSSLRPMRLSQPYFSHTDVPPTAAYAGGAGNSFGHGGGVSAGGDLSGMGGDSFGAAPLRMSSSLPATPHQATAPQSLSFATAMWVDGGDTEMRGSALLYPLQHAPPYQHASQQQQQQQATTEYPLGPWACTRPCFYAPSENSAWVEHTRHGAATPTATLTPMLPVPSICNRHYNVNNMYSEPATPMLTPQLNQHQLQYPYASQQPQRHPSTSPQHTFSYSAMSTPHVSHLLPPAAQRSRSGLVRGAAAASNSSPGSPVMPEVFCKFQRSDAQRLRRRAPPLPPGTECPGMAGRLAYEAHRDAVRRGLVKEEEECSYYLSHHHYSPVPSPTAGVAASRGSGSVAGTNGTHEDRASAASPPSTRASEAPQRSQPGRPAAATRPLCVVSLADLRTTPSPLASRKPQQHAASSPPKPHDACTPHRHHSVEMEEVDDQRSRSSSSGVAQQSSEWSETWNGPRLLFQIPRCCDDPYHRDEEALEMMSITTASSCAFGAGLDGLAWREWMPSSPVEAGEEVLRTFAAAAAKASAAAVRSGSPSGSAHVHNSSHVSTTLSGSMHGGQLPCGTHAVGGGGLGALGGTSFVVPSTVGTTSLSVNANPPLSGTVGGPAALVAPLTPLDIAAPRNADDMNDDDDDTAEGTAGVPRHHRTETGGQSISSATASGLAASGGTGASGKRPFIAEWLVSKLQKHLEKKKLKKLQRQQAREAATVTAVYGGGTPPTNGEAFPSNFLTEARLSRDTADARRTGTTTTSTVSDYSDASSRHSSSGNGGAGNIRSTQQQQQQQQSPTPELIAQEKLRQHQRLAYLAAAYQTELVIYEQKRRETLANRRGIQAVVEHSRARMTPEAAAAGYIYEAHACGADNSHHHQHLQHPQQQRQQEQQVFALATSPKQQKDVSNVPDSVSSDSYSSVYSQAVVSVASPVATEAQAKTETTTVAPRPVAAVDNEPFGTEAAPLHLQPPQQHHHGNEPRKGAPMSVVKARGAAERMEAERRRVALDTVRTKQKSIETWIRALGRQL